MSIGAPTGGVIWSEPARPSLGVSVSMLRWVYVSNGVYMLAASGAAAASVVDNGDGTMTLTDATTAGTVRAVGIGTNALFSGSGS